MENRPISSIFGRSAPQEGFLAGYGWLITHFSLAVPPPRRIALISGSGGRRTEGNWLLFGERYRPEDDPYEQLVFALKYEGIDLHILKAVFAHIGPPAVTQMINREPTGQYARRLWFLYEWLFEESLALPDSTSRDYYDLIDPDLQYTGPSRKSRRHGIRNNLPGTREFCPLVHRSEKLDALTGLQLQERVQDMTEGISRDLQHRAATFLLLKDSRASYAIEGERPPLNRAQRWAAAIGQAGRTPLSRDEIERLQQIMLHQPTFALGYRTEGGFIGERDRITLDPLPEHISARHDDLDSLMEGLFSTAALLEESDIDPAIAAAAIAFGFVFIHPFLDGNGRLHRYLVHHMLSAQQFSPSGMVFPISAVMFERIDAYHSVLEEYSLPRLDLIEWEATAERNVRVLNDTIDLYRYFDATPQAEFLYDCVRETIEVTLPAEIDELQKHDAMMAWLEERFEMPDNTATLLIGFLRQGEGTLSKRAREKEFSFLSAIEVEEIQKTYTGIYNQE